MFGTKKLAAKNGGRDFDIRFSMLDIGRVYGLLFGVY